MTQRLNYSRPLCLEYGVQVRFASDVPLRAKDYAFKSIQKIEALKDNLAANKPILRNILLSTISRVEVARESMGANSFGVELVFK